MSQIVDDLRQVAIEIKTETQVGGNTAARVGGAFERVADALEGTQQIEDMDAAVAAVQQAAQENEQTIQDIVNNLAVVQTTGQSTSAVMSQKAVTDELYEETLIFDGSIPSTALNSTTQALTTPAGFKVGKKYKIVVTISSSVSKPVNTFLRSIPSSATPNIRFDGVSAPNLNIPAGETTKTCYYTPSAETNYQYFNRWGDVNTVVTTNWKVYEVTGWKEIGIKKLSGIQGYATNLNVGIGNFVETKYTSVSVTTYELKVNEGDVFCITAQGANLARCWGLIDSDRKLLFVEDAGVFCDNKILIIPSGVDKIVFNALVADTTAFTGYPDYKWYYAKKGSVGALIIPSRSAKYTKYDDTQSNLDTDNVQEALDKTVNRLGVLEETSSICRESQEDSDLDIVDENNRVLVRFYNGHIKTKNFDSANIVASSSAEYRKPLMTQPTDVTKPQHIGQINVQRKVEILCGLVWTPIRPMPSTSIGFTSDGTEDTNVVRGRKYFYANTQITGIPYSSTGINGKSIGCDITIETFMTALKNPNSVLYTVDLRNTLSGNLVGSYYGNNCSSFTNYIQGIYAICKGRNNNYAANRILRNPKNADALQIGDMIYLQRATIDSGHAVIVYRIDKDENGYITRIYEAEEDSKKANIYNYTKEQFVNRFFKGGYGYVSGDIYRNVDLVDNEYMEDFDDSTYVYSDTVGLNLGNNTNYDKADNMPIEVTMLSSVGFSVIRNGTTIATYSASSGVAGWGDTRIVTLDKSSLAVGTYEIRPTSGLSQYFHLCDSGSITAIRDIHGNLTVDASGFSNNVTPYAVLFVSSRASQTTRGLYLMDGASSVTIPKDWFDFINTTNDIAYALVIYRNEYGNIYTEPIMI